MVDHPPHYPRRVLLRPNPKVGIIMNKKVLSIATLIALILAALLWWLTGKE
jgi:hypothetical protein